MLHRLHGEEADQAVPGMQGPRGKDYSAVYGDLSKDNIDRQETKAGGKLWKVLQSISACFLREQ